MNTQDDIAPAHYQEPLRSTMVRTGLIALLAGAVLAGRSGGLARWPMASLLMLWPSFGGHWVELWFLNWLRPRLSVSRTVQTAVRVIVWFIGGTGLFLGMRLTAMALPGFWPRHWPSLWLGGLAFIVIELAVHVVLQLRGQPNFFTRRG